MNMEEDPDRPPSVLLEAMTLRCEIDTNGPVLELPKPTYVKNVSRRFSDAVHSFSVRGRTKSVSFGVASGRRCHSHTPDTGPRGSDEGKTLHGLRPPLKSSQSLPARVIAAKCVHGEHSVRFVERRKMRRLSEMITDWERPSRTSLSNMYAYARRESVYIARKKLAGLKRIRDVKQLSLTAYPRISNDFRSDGARPGGRRDIRVKSVEN